MIRPTMIRYHLRLADLDGHRLEVEIDAPPTGAHTCFALPAWSPGSYLIRDYARHLVSVKALDEADRALPLEKRDKQTFVVASAGADRVKLRYEVYAHELTVRTSHVDRDHAFIHGPATFLYLPERMQEPAELTLAAPDGWQVLTALPARADGRFEARDYDHLVDSPIELGGPRLQVSQFEAAGRPHRLAICGRAEGTLDRPGLCGDTVKIIEAASALFGGLPYEQYLFILHLSAQGGQGGLEHRDSSALLASSYSLRPRKKYEDLLELIAHEHFHAWNVKRIRPRALGPFDYTRENHTRSLWVMEGITSYYDRHLLLRAGLMNAKRYLERLGEELARLRQVPGRFVHSLEEASFDAWTKFYKPDEATPNTTVSYYLKGSLVAMALDLEIRRGSGGARSLDDCMRLLWERHGRAAQGFPDDAIQALFEAGAGQSLGDFFGAHVRGRQELALEPFLQSFGLRAQPPPPEPQDSPGAWLGIQTRELPSGRSQVTSALDGGPAARAGLYAGDEIVALDGFRVEERTLRERLGARQPGERASVTVFRRDELRQVEVELGERPPESYAITPDPQATPEARKLYSVWLGEPFPEKTEG